MLDLLFGLFGIVAVVIAGLDSWSTGVKMRRRLQHQLGRKVDDATLISIHAWMSDGLAGSGPVN